MPDPTPSAACLTAETKHALEALSDDDMTIACCPKCDPEDVYKPAAEHCDDCPRQAAANALALIDQQARELAALRAQVETIREQTLNEALVAVKAEHLEDPQETDGDAGYEHAIGDAVNALEALRQRDRPATELA